MLVGKKLSSASAEMWLHSVTFDNIIVVGALQPLPYTRTAYAALDTIRWLLVVSKVPYDAQISNPVGPREIMKPLLSPQVTKPLRS